MEDNHYKIKYHALSVVGNTRTHNEDNLFCDGYTRPYEEDETYSHSGEILSRDNKILAVFDGIGGEVKGEVASLIASNATKSADFTGENVGEKILDFMNLDKEDEEKILDYITWQDIPEQNLV